MRWETGNGESPILRIKKLRKWINADKVDWIQSEFKVNRLILEQESEKAGKRENLSAKSENFYLAIK